MAGERIKLFEADIDVDGIIKKSQELKNAILDTKDAQAIAKIKFGEASEEYVKAEAKVKKLSAEYRINQQQVSNLTSASGDFLNVEQKLNMAMQEEIKTINSAKANNKELRIIRNEINADTKEGADAIAEINKKIDENTEFIKSNVSELEVNKINIGDYKNQIKDAYNELNIFNGGILGFVQRAQQAGGVMPLLKNGLMGITQGIYGATKASLAFIATPIGVVIAAIGLVLGAVIGYLKSTQKGIDLVTSVTRPLSAVLDALIGILQEVGEFLFEAFSKPQETIKQVYEFVKDKVIRVFNGYFDILAGIATLDFDRAKQGLADINEVAVEGINAIKEAAGALGDRLQDAFIKGQRIDELQKLQERKEIDIIAYRAEQERQLKVLENIQKNQLLSAQERNDAIAEGEKIAKELVARENEILDLEIEQLKLKQSLNDTSREEEKELQELVAQRIKNTERILDVEKKALGDRKQLATEQQNIAKKAFDDSIKRQQLELQIYLESQGIKKRSLAEELSLAEENFRRELEIEKQKLQAKKISQQEFDLFVIQSENELAEIRVEIASKALDDEIEAFKNAHQTKIDDDKFFSEEKLQLEQERLDLILEKERAYFEEKLALGVLSETEYNEEIAKIREEYQEGIDQAEEQRRLAKKEKEAIDLANKREAELANLEYDLEFQLMELEAKRQQEIEAAEKTGADVALIEAKYAKQRMEIEETVQNNKLDLYSQTAANFVSILGKESALGKAAAITQTTIDTYQAAMAAFKGMVQAIPGPVGFALGGVAAGAAVARGLANVKKIAGTKLPKARRGMYLNIGGKSHGQGGTKFYGEDGTAFEAEKGEKMFVLNRQASAALAPLLSDINQQYGGVSLSKSSSYLASGGQILRSTTNNVDLDNMARVVSDSVREGSREGSKEGSREGSMEGSSRGTYSGIVDKETNEAIAAGANF